jgi:hypothetical protein
VTLGLVGVRRRHGRDAKNPGGDVGRSRHGGGGEVAARTRRPRGSVGTHRPPARRAGRTCTSSAATSRRWKPATCSGTSSSARPSRSVPRCAGTRSVIGSWRRRSRATRAHRRARTGRVHRGGRHGGPQRRAPPRLRPGQAAAPAAVRPADRRPRGDPRLPQGAAPCSCSACSAVWWTSSRSAR